MIDFFNFFLQISEFVDYVTQCNTNKRHAQERILEHIRCYVAKLWPSASVHRLLSNQIIFSIYFLIFDSVYLSHW